MSIDRSTMYRSPGLEEAWAAGDSPRPGALVMKASPCAFNFPWEGTRSQNMIFISFSSDSCLVQNQEGVEGRGEEVEEKFNCHMTSRKGS